MNASGVFQAVLWLQMFLWAWLYHRELSLDGWPQIIFYIAYGAAIFYIITYQPFTGYFTPWLFFQYTIYVMMAVTLLTERFGFRRALSLGFLLVFLNSFYWEVWYHLYEVYLLLPASLSPGYWYLRIPQYMRLVPAYWLGRWFELKGSRFLFAGLGASLFLTFARFALRAGPWVLVANRVVCLAALVYTIIISPEKNIQVVEKDGA